MSKAINQEFLNIFDTFNRVIKSNSFDAIWISRQLLIGHPPFVELIVKKPIIYDIDDAVFLTSFFAKKQVEYISRRSNVIFAANDYLADCLSSYNNSIYVIPTTVDTEMFVPAYESPDKDIKKMVTIGWSGTSSSYKYFHQIEDVLVKLLKQYKNVELIFVSDMYPYELKKLSKYVKFIKWNEDIDVLSIQRFDIGIMPIIDDDWSRGKSAYKVLLYASCGIPVITTFIGENKKILKEAEIGLGVISSSDWYDAIEYMILNEGVRRFFGETGREYVIKNKSINTYAPIISKLISDNV